MIIEEKIKKILCDCCRKELYDNGIRKNNGSFEEPFLLLDNGIALDYVCAGKIFYREVVKKIPPQKLEYWIKSLKKVEGPNPLGPELDLSADILRRVDINPEMILFDVVTNKLPESTQPKNEVKQAKQDLVSLDDLPKSLNDL